MKRWRRGWGLSPELVVADVELLVEDEQVAASDCLVNAVEPVVQFLTRIALLLEEFGVPSLGSVLHKATKHARRDLRNPGRNVKETVVSSFQSGSGAEGTGGEDRGGVRRSR